MTIETIERELTKRDEAIQAELKALKATNVKLADKATALGDQVHALEQKGASVLPEGKHKYSIMKAIKSVVDPERFKLDGLERETHQEFQSKMASPMPGTIWIPMNTKAVDYGTVNFNSPLESAGGSNVVPQQLGSLVDMLRQASVIMGLNPTLIQATGDLDLPTKASGSTAYWVSGEGEDITESQPTFSKKTLRPKYLSALVSVYARMLTQTGGDIERIIAQDLVNQLAVEFDRVCIQGSGSGSEPTGITNTAGVLTDVWTDSPATFQWGDALTLESKLLVANSNVGTVATVLDPTTQATLKGRTKVSADAGAGFLIENGQMNGHPVFATNNCPSNTIVHGNFEDLAIANWGAIGVSADPYGTSFASGSTRIRAMLPTDIAILHPASFVVSTPS